MIRSLLAAFISVLLGTVAMGQTPVQSPPKPLSASWENITEKLWTQIPDYQHDPAWYNRRVGTLHVDNTTGDLYVMLCARWGSYRSTDCGTSWRQVDATALGRQVENRGICPNPVTGDFVLFKVNGGPPQQGAIVVNHGSQWLPIPSAIGDGFRCGMVDWSQNPPTTILAVRHHHDGLYLSEDGGEHWNELPRNGGYGAAMLDANTIFLCRDKQIDPDNLLVNGTKRDAKGLKWWLKFQPKDIVLSTDRCKTFVKVAVFCPRAETPTRFGDHLYWIAAEGVMVTRDRGRSWDVLGQPIQDLLYGPFFGKDEKSMMVVTKSGFHVTTDAGEDWKKVADMMIPEGGKIELAHPGWDPVRRVIYLGFLGDDVYCCRFGGE